MTTEIKTTTYNQYLLTFGIILIIAIIGVIGSFVFTFARTGSDEEKISTLREEVVALKSQLSTAESQLSTAQAELDSLASQVMGAEGRVASISEQRDADVATLQEGLTTANNQIDALSSQIGSVLSQLSGLQAEVIADDSNIATLQSQLSSINTQLASLGETTASLGNTLTSLGNTVDSLVSQVNRLTSTATNPVILFSSQAISQAFGAQTLLYTSTPTYNGHFRISGTSSSTTGYIRVTNNSTATYTDYPFGTGTTVTAAVTAGYSYSIIFGNSDASGTITALLSATYNY